MCKVWHRSNSIHVQVARKINIYAVHTSVGYQVSNTQSPILERDCRSGQAFPGQKVLRQSALVSQQSAVMCGKFSALRRVVITRECFTLRHVLIVPRTNSILV